MTLYVKTNFMINDNEPTDYYPRRNKWLRAICIVVILVAFGFAEALLWFLALIQFFWVIVKSEPNEHIQSFAYKLSKWTSNAISFSLWRTDMPPFPFTKWPDDS